MYSKAKFHDKNRLNLVMYSKGKCHGENLSNLLINYSKVNCHHNN